MNYFFQKLVNSFLKQGNKQRSEGIVFDSLSNIKFKFKNKKNFSMKNSLFNLELNSRSWVDLKDNNSRRNKFKIPFFVKLRRTKRIAVKSIEKSIKKRSEFLLVERVTKELYDVLKNKGLTIKNKELIYSSAIETILKYRFRLKKRRRRRKKIKKF